MASCIAEDVLACGGKREDWTGLSTVRESDVDTVVVDERGEVSIMKLGAKYTQTEVCCDDES